MSDSERFDYESINALAKELGRPVSTLIALSPNNDPSTPGCPHDKPTRSGSPKSGSVSASGRASICAASTTA